jgi:hypothetical protein
MITVGIAKDWDWPDLLRQTPGGKGVLEWDAVYSDPRTDCDFLVVLNNKMKVETRAQCPPENVWCLMQEPYMKGHTDWMVEKLEPYSRVLTHHVPFNHSKFTVSQPAIPWHVNKTFDQLVALEMPAKPKTLSWVVGNANDLPGHGKRLAFWNIFKKTAPWTLTSLEERFGSSKTNGTGWPLTNIPWPSKTAAAPTTGRRK